MLQYTFCFTLIDSPNLFNISINIVFGNLVFNLSFIENNLKILEDIDNSSIPPEKVFENAITLNNYFNKSSNENILYVNIRSLQANLNMFTVFLDILNTKPIIIICPESWQLKFPNLIKIKGYI